MKREFDAEAVWGVKFRRPKVGGDYDVLARVDGDLFYLEVKSSPPKQIYDSEVAAFLDRVDDLAPENRMFLMDTELRMKDKIVPMFEQELAERMEQPPRSSAWSGSSSGSVTGYSSLMPRRRSCRTCRLCCPGTTESEERMAAGGEKSLEEELSEENAEGQKAGCPQTLFTLLSIYSRTKSTARPISRVCGRLAGEPFDIGSLEHQFQRTGKVQVKDPGKLQQLEIVQRPERREVDHLPLQHR